MVIATVVVLLSLAIAAVMELQARSNASRDARLHLSQASAMLNSLQDLPWQADPRVGGSPTRTLRSMKSMETRIGTELASLHRGWSPPELDRIEAPLAADYAALAVLRRAVVAHGSTSRAANDLGYEAIGLQARLAALLNRASAGYARRADRASTESLAGSAAVIAGLVGAFLLLYRRERARLREKAEREMLRQREDELRLLVRRLEAAQTERERLLARTVEVAEHERIRVAQDLHDGPIQQLTAVALRLDLFKLRVERHGWDDSRDIAGEIRGEIADAIAALRDVMVQLRPPVLSERGLLAALQEAADRILGVDVTHTVDRDVDVSTLELEPEAETVIYRIAHEALTNVAKHAHASHVDVSLTHTDDALVLTVEDDGVGFLAARPADRDSNGTHYGLIGMRERIESLRGHLTVRSRPGEGTRIRAELPLPSRGSELSGRRRRSPLAPSWA